MKGMANDNNSSANSMLRCQRKIIVIYRPNGVISKQTEIVATRFAFFQIACSSGDADPDAHHNDCSIVAHPELQREFIAA